MKYHAENAVSSFFYYMWNAWSKEECRVVFGGMYKHFWEKWNAQARKSIYGAAERFYSELSENYQRLLVERAVSLYDGKAHRKQPDDSEVYVCCECGSQQVEIQVWADANTDECHSDVDDDSNGRWCTECESHIHFCSKAEFIQKMQAWWQSCDSITKERISGLKGCNTDEWWGNLDYDGKRNVYSEHNSNNE
ncbi:hypothetical protein JQN09_14980 [Phocaeicola dorei]|uniref:hypothetical protein n=1 Tax=Phocaeicola dorei TaxID=357276 RepID=UPI001BDDF307|nr:hypothetical protein [Phocaeicola dorei]MBT1308511.1 hypothetical protein [Phocaeicola dorei]MBT1313222.1 hypothetical protein [Phocaeicola dorei]